MIGWAVATGNVSVESLLMFALIFAWTPPHFWALALFMKGDYENAGVPMLTVTHGRESTRKHVLVYSILLFPVAIAAALSDIGGPLTLLVAATSSAWFVVQAWAIFRRDDVQGAADEFATERRFFRFSLWYLFAIFASFLAETALGAFGLGGW